MPMIILYSIFSSAFMSLAAQFSNHKLNGRSKKLWPERNDLWPSADKSVTSARSSLEFDSHLPSYMKSDCKDEQKKETSIKSDKLGKNHNTGRIGDEKTIDIVDWEAVRQATVDEIAKAIKQRGMNNVIAGKIKVHTCLSRFWLVNKDINIVCSSNYLCLLTLLNVLQDFLNKIVESHGSPDLEWLRHVPPEEAKYVKQPKYSS